MLFAKRFRGFLAADDLPRKQQKVHIVKVISQGLSTLGSVVASD
jgi:hypothetical protein